MDFNKKWYVNGFDYSKTPANWLQNFDDNQATVKVLEYGMDYAKFRRLWRFYLIGFIRNLASCDREYSNRQGI